MYFNILRYNISDTSICLFNVLLEDNSAHSPAGGTAIPKHTVNTHTHTTVHASVKSCKWLKSIIVKKIFCKNTYEKLVDNSEVECHLTYLCSRKTVQCLQRVIRPRRIDSIIYFKNRDEIKDCGKITTPLRASKLNNTMCNSNSQSDFSTEMQRMGIITDAYAEYKN